MSGYRCKNQKHLQEAPIRIRERTTTASTIDDDNIDAFLNESQKNSTFITVLKQTSTPPSFGRGSQNYRNLFLESFQSPQPQASSKRYNRRQRTVESLNGLLTIPTTNDGRRQNDGLSEALLLPDERYIFQSPLPLTTLFESSPDTAVNGDKKNEQEEMSHDVSPVRSRRSGKRSIDEISFGLQEDSKQIFKRRRSTTISPEEKLKPRASTLQQQKTLRNLESKLPLQTLHGFVISTPTDTTKASSLDTTSESPIPSPTSRSGFTPLQFVADRVLKPLFSTFSLSEKNGTKQKNMPDPVGTSTSPSNPFIPSSSSIFSSYLLHKRSNTTNTYQSHNSSIQPSKGLDLLHKFPNFLSSTKSSTSLINFSDLPDLISEEVGGKIIFATDEFFSSAGNLLKSTEPEWNAAEFTEYGKKYDGWETRRRREAGHDWCLIELGVPGSIKGVEIDTRYFTGNHVPYFSIEACHVPDLKQQVNERLKKNGYMVYHCGDIGISQSKEAIDSINQLLRDQTELDSRQWRDLVPMSPLQPGGEPEISKQRFTVSSNLNSNNQDDLPPEIVTHIRLNAFPDGGIARLKLYGCGMKKINEKEDSNFAAITNGALVLGCSNKHFGDPRNLLLTTPPKNMGSGWETARNPHRAAIVECDLSSGLIKNLVGKEWVIIKLGHKGLITRLEIDTKHFIGNYPESVEIEALDLSDIDQKDLEQQKQYVLEDSLDWKNLLSRTKLLPNTNHVWFNRLVRPRSRQSQLESASRTRSMKQIDDDDVTILNDIGYVTHLRMTIYPDGGIARLRVFGKLPNKRN